MGICIKRMQRIVGYYFRNNFAELKLFGKHDEIYLNCCQNSCKLHGPNQFIQKLSIRSICSTNFQNGSKIFRYIGLNCNRFLCVICLSFLQLTGHDLDCIKDILDNVETVMIELCKMNRKFYEKFPKLCPNLKRLYCSTFSM